MFAATRLLPAVNWRGEMLNGLFWNASSVTCAQLLAEVSALSLFEVLQEFMHRRKQGQHRLLRGRLSYVGLTTVVLPGVALFDAGNAVCFAKGSLTVHSSSKLPLTWFFARVVTR